MISLLLIISCGENYNPKIEDKEIIEIKLYCQSRKLVPIHYSNASIESLKKNTLNYNFAISSPEEISRIELELDLLEPSKSEIPLEVSLGGEIVYSSMEKGYWLIDVGKKLVEYNGNIYSCSDSFLLYVQNLLIEDFAFNYTKYLLEQIGEQH